jgi:lipopolysaccharide transport system permease protein
MARTVREQEARATGADGRSPRLRRLRPMASSSPSTTAAEAKPRLRIDSRRRWFPDLKAIFGAWQLLVLLSRRDITVKYRQTILGTLWIFTGPLVSAGLFTFVFGRVAGMSSDGVPYFAFSYAGMLGWTLFSETLLGASKSLTQNTGLVSKIYFPRLILPLSTVASALIITAISLGLMAVLLVFYDIGFSLRMLWLPAWLLLALALAIGIAFALTAVAVSYRDVNYLTPVIVPLLLYLTPVGYSSGGVPHDLRYFYLLNPVATIVDGVRWSVLGRSFPSTWTIVYTVALALGALVGGLMVFARQETKFADVI